MKFCAERENPHHRNGAWVSASKSFAMVRRLSTTLAPTETRHTATSIAAHTTGCHDHVSAHCFSLDDCGPFVKTSVFPHLTRISPAATFMSVMKLSAHTACCLCRTCCDMTACAS